MKLSFSVDKTFDIGIKRLSALLGFECGEGGISVSAEKRDFPGVSLSGGKAVIYYKEKHQFFRELGVLVEKAKRSDSFTVNEDGFFDMLGIMIDASRCAVATVETMHKMTDYLALMGYSMAMLYTEDTVELEDYPYFGYMRGRYTEEELRKIDDYAFDYGIEIIPCIECYGHMGKYLRWDAALPVKDTDEVLLAREEKTFELLEALIKKISSCYRTKKIHIGMDEAMDMGRGVFLDRNGYVPPFDIFNEYMERLVGITKKYGLQPMMWSDMYFRISSKDQRTYCAPDIVVPEDVRAKIPEDISLVFWHYGEKNRCDGYMLKKHKELGRNVIFAGGLWSWNGHFPEYIYAYDCTKFSLEACRENGIREAMVTVWSNDNAECDLYSNLFGISFFAELAYDKDASEEKLRERFEAVTGGSYDAFATLGLYHNRHDDETFRTFHDRFFGKALFWQDIMEGLYDSKLFKRPMSHHYAECAQKIKEYVKDEKWGELYEHAYRVFDYLALKTKIAEELVPAYKRDDRQALSRIADTELPALREKCAEVRRTHRARWFSYNKIVGWSNLDVRYGGVIARCETAEMLIKDYLDGASDKIEELEVERLDNGLSGFYKYARIATPIANI